MRKYLEKVDEKEEKGSKDHMTTKTKPEPQQYDETSIRTYEGTEAIRKRPGMYLGTGENATQQCAYEIFSNSVDEHLAGGCSEISIILDEDLRGARISDNGRGLPYKEIDVKGKKVSAAIQAATSLHAGGKFDAKSYAVSGGTHGVGLTSVNAVSDRFEVEIRRDGAIHRFACSKGKVTEKLTSSGKTKKTGTSVYFQLDPTVMEVCKLDPVRIAEMCRMTSYLYPGLLITCTTTAANAKIKQYHSEDGLADYIRAEIKGRKLVTKDVMRVEGIQKSGDKEVHVDCAFMWTDSEEELSRSFVNGISTVNGGTHLTGFRLAVATVIGEAFKAASFKGVKELHKDDFREGLVAAISVRIKEPTFHSQTKDSLGSREAQGAVQALVMSYLKDIFTGDNPEAKAILNRVVNAARGRQAAKRAREVTRKETLGDYIGQSAKLKDCISTNPEECELFLVEGDSASGSATEARDSNNQAILAMKGKILNTYGKPKSDILDNTEISSIVAAIGCGIGDDCDPSKARYGKIIAMCDADVDGNHIVCLILTLLFYHMRPLIEAGMVYVAKSPLYLLKKKGEIVGYLDGESDAEEWKTEHVAGYAAKKGLDPNDPETVVAAMKGWGLNYLKGLGELNPEDLWATTMDPNNRTLLRMNVKDFESCDVTMRTLMDPNDVESRKQFIVDNISFSRLDI
jgi:DNA gyrase subunit B